MSLICGEIIKLRKNLIIDGTSGLKLELTSCSYNAYHVTNFCCFEKFLAYTLFLPSLNGVKPQMAELNWWLPPLSIIGVSRTQSNIGLRRNCPIAMARLLLPGVSKYESVCEKSLSFYPKSNFLWHKFVPLENKNFWNK